LIFKHDFGLLQVSGAFAMTEAGEVCPVFIFEGRITSHGTPSPNLSLKGERNVKEQ
jgi:hypothetical protein